MRRRSLVSKMMLIVMMLMWVGVASAAVVDITDKVNWNSRMNMYVPNTYGYSLFFDGYTPDNRRVFGALFLNPASAANGFEVYLSNSLTSSPEQRLTRVTLETVPDLALPYSIVDKGSLSTSIPGVNFKYGFTTKKTGFGEANFLDWQLGSNGASATDVAHPGSIFYAKMSGAGTFDMEKVISDNLRAIVKVQGTESAFIEGQPVATPEMPPIAMPLLAAALGMGLYLRARFAR